MVSSINFINKALRALRSGLTVCFYRDLSNGSFDTSFVTSAELLEEKDLSVAIFSNEFYVIATKEYISRIMDFNDGNVARIFVKNYQNIIDLLSTNLYLMKKCLNSSSFEAGDELDTVIVKILKAAELMPSAVVAKKSFDSEKALRDFCIENYILCFPVTDFILPISHKFEEVCKSDLFLAGVKDESIIKASVKVYRDSDLCKVHYVIIIGEPFQSDEILIRLHSSCYTGDLLMSLSCDCCYQLRSSIEFMANNGGGIILYLSQEGRGIGLVNKIRAYDMQQNHSCDTLDANIALGFLCDERDFGIAAGLLKKLNVTKSIALLTNNPKKLNCLQGYGFDVTRCLPIPFVKNKYNAEYLSTKIFRMGHINLEY